MSLLSLGLVIVAAILHAGWNLILKQVDEKYIVNWWAVLASAALLAPVVFASGWPAPAAWPFLIASAAVEAIYMAVLVAAYNLSDFSLVYPVARGAAPAFLAVWAVIFLGERITALGGAGLALLVAGLMVVGSSGLTKRATDVATTRETTKGTRRETTSGRANGILLALGVAVLISIYSTIDGAAVKLTPATPYTVVMLGLSGVFFTPFALRQSGWRAAAAVARRHWPRILAIGIGSTLAYILVLNAYAIGQVSYAGAVREVSVVFGALAGWKLLGEELGKQRVIGAVMIFGGILIIAFGG